MLVWENGWMDAVRGLHDEILVPVLLYDSETLTYEYDKFIVRIVGLDFWDLLRYKDWLSEESKD